MLLLSIFLPLFSFIILFFFSFKIGYKGVKLVSFINSLITFLLSIWFLINTLKGNFYYLTCGYWINLGILSINWSFTFDILTSLMFFTVSLISFLVIIFSFEYMVNDPFFSRFISLLSIFTFFMLFFISSDNFIQFFLGWEGIGLCSYLLINFWFSRIQATKSAFKALIVNRVGDVSLLASFSIIFLLYGTLDFSILKTLIPYYRFEYILIFNYKINLLFLIGLFLMIGVMSKSAQIGLHTWLPDAMEGPTPVSALIHAATMVTAGVYLIIRISFIFEFIPYLLNIVSLLGAFTAFFSATIALVQMDIKKLIAYSTCSQLGYMVFSCGLSLYTLSLFHLFNHAFFKALLFLSAGSIIHSLQNEQDLRRMGGLLKILPNSYISIMIASLSLCGFPFLSGFYSKDLIIEFSFLNFELNNIFCFWLIYCCAFLTVLYSIKLLFLVFYSKFNYYKINYIFEGGFYIYFSQVILIIFSIFSGYFFKEVFIGFGNLYIYNSILELPKYISFFEIECFIEILIFYNISFFYYIILKFLPLYSTFFGLFIYYFYYIFFYKLLVIYFLKNKKIYSLDLKFIKIPILNNKFFINFYIKSIFFLSNKWYIDYIYNNFLVKSFLVFNFTIFFNFFDKGLIEFFGPSEIILKSIRFSRFNIKLQQFNFILNFIFLIFFFILLIFIYIYIIYRLF